MKPIGFFRTALVLGLAAGCGALSGGQGGAGGNGGVGGSGGTGDGGGSRPNCIVTLRAMPEGPYVAPADVTLGASTTGSIPPYTYTWSSSPPALTPRTNEPGMADLHAPVPGAYTIDVQSRSETGDLCVERLVINVDDRNGSQGLVRLRFIPSPQVAPQQEFLQSITGGGTREGLTFTMQGGSAVLLRPVLEAGGTQVPSYLRLRDSVTGLQLDTYTSGQGTAFVRLLNDPLDVLVLPEDVALAPALVHSDGRTLAADGRLILDGGYAILGSVFDGTGLPLPGARVELRSPAQLSSLATTGTDGRFRVAATPGTYGLRVVPPDTQALPMIEDDDITIIVDPSSLPTLVVTFGPPARARFGAIVTEPTGAPAVGARLRLTARSLTTVGNASIGGATPLGLAGSVERTLITDSSGLVPPMDLPAALYDLLIEPAGASTAARTRRIVDLTAQDAPALAVMLSRPVSVRGSVQDDSAHPIEGARVQFVEADATALFIGITDRLGAFDTMVDPGANYLVIVTPPVAASAPLARVSLQAQAGETTTALPAIKLPAGLPISGTLFGPDARPLAGALVQACTLACPSGEWLADTMTDTDGFFRIVVPDPGSSSRRR